MFDNIHPQIQLLPVAHAAQPYALSTIGATLSCFSSFYSNKRGLIGRYLFS